jgi:FMN hydrolase / 5-amino-6-(5-phospho-D-ribitylamino)uracil phosphatase
MSRQDTAYNSSVNFTIRAITLDLDDTLWPFALIGARIEQVLDAWLCTHSPRTAEAFPSPRMHALREGVIAAHPHLLHDMSTLCRLTLETAFTESGEAPGQVRALTERAYDVFYAERNRVEYYPDALEALQRISARLPILALSNGNADLARVGIGHLFVGQLGAREHGAPKPEASIFHAACERLGCAPHEVLHVGDHIDMDVVGAARAGLRTAWVHRDDLREHHPHWPHADIVPDLIVHDLAALADRIDLMLEGATLEHAKLEHAKLEHAKLEHATFDNARASTSLGSTEFTP